jgi:hypothetical protein
LEREGREHDDGDDDDDDDDDRWPMPNGASERMNEEYRMNE